MNHGAVTEDTEQKAADFQEHNLSKFGQMVMVGQVSSQELRLKSPPTSSKRRFSFSFPY